MDNGRSRRYCLHSEKISLIDIGPAPNIGFTRINGVANTQLACNSELVSVTLDTSFGQTWMKTVVEPAVLENITIQTIQKVHNKHYPPSGS